MANIPGFEYSYRELAFDNYHEASELLDKLVEVREMHGLSQRQLAERMNVSQGYVSRIENGRTSLLDNLNAYAIAAGARIRYVVEPAERKPQGARAHAMEARTAWAEQTDGRTAPSSAWDTSAHIRVDAVAAPLAGAGEWA